MRLYSHSRRAAETWGKRVGRSTIRRILKRTGLPPVPQRPAFLKAHWGGIAGADFPRLRCGRGVGTRMIDLTGRVRRSPRLGGVLNFYGGQPDGHG